MLSTEEEWTNEEEIQLFSALNGLRPVGINKHFFMVCIVDRLSKTLNRKITSEQIWTHLKTMYNLKTLDEQEPLPFPNNLEEFKMPEIFDPKSEYNRFRLELEQINPRRSESEDGDGSSKGAPSTSSTSTTTTTTPKPVSSKSSQSKESDRKSSKNESNDSTLRYPAKRTRGSLSVESGSSPANTPPSSSQQKRRRI
ncbi:unnamed protein product [Diamesa hyperborea]